MSYLLHVLNGKCLTVSPALATLTTMSPSVGGLLPGDGVRCELLNTSFRIFAAQSRTSFESSSFVAHICQKSDFVRSCRDFFERVQARRQYLEQLLTLICSVHPIYKGKFS